MPYTGSLTDVANDYTMNLMMPVLLFSALQSLIILLNFVKKLKNFNVDLDVINAAMTTPWNEACNAAKHMIDEIVSKWSIHVGVFISILTTIIAFIITAFFATTVLLWCVTVLLIIILVFIAFVWEDASTTLVFDVSNHINDIDQILKDLVNNLEAKREFRCYCVSSKGRSAIWCTLDMKNVREYNLRVKLEYVFIKVSSRNLLIVNVYVRTSFYRYLWESSIKGYLGSIELYSYLGKPLKYKRGVLILRTFLGELREDLVLEISHLIAFLAVNKGLNYVGFT